MAGARVAPVHAVGVMAKYIPVGEPTNQSEADAIRALRDTLPQHFVVIGNFELQLPNRSNTFEFDAVVIGEYGLYAVEIKGWSGGITGDIRRWYLDWGRVQNPFILTERKAKALRSFIWRAVDDLPRDVYCQAVIMLPPNARVEVDDPRTERVLNPATIFDFFVDESRIRAQGPGPLLDDNLRDRIENALLPLASPAAGNPRVADYEIVGELDDDRHPYQEFVGRHRLLRSRSQVRVKKYSLDPLAKPVEQEKHFERIFRDMEALTQLDSNPYIANAYEVIRDQEDELIFYLVSEWVGANTLRDHIARNGAASRTEARRMAAHLLRAVQFMHERGIVHRNLHPEVIYLTDDNRRIPFKIADFDYARVIQLPSIEGNFEEMGTEGYTAPELWRSNDYDHRVDLFSVGAILFEVTTGKPLYDTLNAMLNHEATWQRRRVEVEDGQCREILGALLQTNPDDRPSDLSNFVQAIEHE